MLCQNSSGAKAVRMARAWVTRTTSAATNTTRMPAPRRKAVAGWAAAGADGRLQIAAGGRAACCLGARRLPGLLGRKHSTDQFPKEEE